MCRSCVAVNNQQPPRDYDLTVTTNHKQRTDLKVGSTDPIGDTLHASNNGSSIKENLNGTAVIHYEGQKNGYVAAKTVSKPITFANSGDTQLDRLATPADFGLSHWQEGQYWIDIQVARQGKMKSAVDTTDKDPSETWTVSAEPPTPPTKTIDEGVSADSMTNRTVITYGTGKGGYEMAFKDEITADGVDCTVDNYRLVDKSDNDRDVSGEFQIGWDKAANTVTAVRTADKGEMPLDHEIEFSFDVTVSKPKDFRKVKDHATGKWNQEPEADAGSKEFDTWQPNPDKSWIFEQNGRWQAVIDPQETNKTGGDSHTYLDGSRLGSVVNGTIGKNLIQAPKKLVLTDDWTAADYIFDADTKNIRVYEAEAGTDRESSVSDIVNTGKDVTDQFDITVQGTKATAAAKTSYLKGLKGLKNPKQVTLLIPGKINFADGKGAEQVRKDYGKAAGDELTFCAAPTGKNLTNSGSETVNNHTEPTNEPQICGYIPPVKKDVVSEASQGGDQESVDGKVVQPGQKVEYQLNTQPQLPADLAYEVKSVSFTDSYDAYLKPDKQTLEMMDLNTGKPVSKKKYTTTWDDSKHMFTLTVTDQETISQWRAGTSPASRSASRNRRRRRPHRPQGRQQVGADPQQLDHPEQRGVQHPAEARPRQEGHAEGPDDQHRRQDRPAGRRDLLPRRHRRQAGQPGLQGLEARHDRRLRRRVPETRRHQRGDHRRDRQGRHFQVQHPGQGRRALRLRQAGRHRDPRDGRDRQGRPAAGRPQGLQRVRRA